MFAFWGCDLSAISRWVVRIAMIAVGKNKDPPRRHGDTEKSRKTNGVEWGKRGDKPGVEWGDMGCEWGGMG